MPASVLGTHCMGHIPASRYVVELHVGPQTPLSHPLLTSVSFPVNSLYPCGAADALPRSIGTPYRSFSSVPPQAVHLVILSLLYEYMYMYGSLEDWLYSECVNEQHFPPRHACSP